VINSEEHVVRWRWNNPKGKPKNHLLQLLHGQHHPRAGQHARLREPGVVPFTGRRCQWHAASPRLGRHVLIPQPCARVNTTRARVNARLREPGVVPFIGRRCTWHARPRARSEGHSPGGLFGRGAPGIFRGGPSRVCVCLRVSVCVCLCLIVCAFVCLCVFVRLCGKKTSHFFRIPSVLVTLPQRRC